MSVRLQPYQVKVIIGLHPRPTLQVLQVFRNVFQVFGHLQVRLIKDIGILDRNTKNKGHRNPFYYEGQQGIIGEIKSDTLCCNANKEPLFTFNLASLQM